MLLTISQLIVVGVTIAFVVLLLGFVLVWLLIRIEERIVRLERCLGTLPEEGERRAVDRKA